MDSIGFLLLIQVILIALNAIFASAEIAVLSISEAKLEKLEEEGNKKATRLRKLTGEPAKFLATIQVAITLSGFLGSAFAADNFSDTLVEWLLGLGITLPRATLDTLSVVLITLILSYFTLIFGELVPKRIAMKKAEALSLGISGLISGISVVFAPIVWLLSISTNAILRLFGIDPNETDDEVSEEEIRMMVDAGSKKGTIDEEEREFIQNIFEFDDLTAGDIATHRTEVTILWTEDSAEEWANVIHEVRHTLFPVCDESPDNVVGILDSRDYFRLQDRSLEALKAIIKPAYFVPETIKADVLFRNMKMKRTTLAVVLDEYGGMVGIVTINDLLEELVGEFTDEPEGSQNEEPHLQQLDENTWAIFGNIPLADIEEATGLDLENEEYDTFTGLVFDTLGMVPADGKQNIDLEIDRMIIHVSQVEDHQIANATLCVKEKEEEPDDEE